MRVVDLIQKKKEGIRLTNEEISFLIRGFTEGKIPDYQMSAYLMACCFQNPDFEETLHMTKEMLHSGKILDLSNLAVPKIDKHSTGGVGDKTSLIIAPIVAACEIAVPMVAGRGLGHTGGTVDKLESIPGFKTHLTLTQFYDFLSKNYIAIIGQTPEIAPADKKIYALRDVTATVECIPLITASIMSKKLAEGTDGIVLDVKFGNGAFMPKLEMARELAQWLVRVGKAFDKKVIAVVSDMNQPLGNKIGNSLEVEESIDILKEGGPQDLKELCLLLSGYMIWLGKRGNSLEKGIELAKEAIHGGRALQKFRQMIKQQGGDERIIDSYKYLPQATYKVPFTSTQQGYVTEINARHIGIAVSLLGGGRNHITDEIDPAVGFILHKKVGDPIETGETLLTIHYNDEKKRGLTEQELKKAYHIGGTKGKVSPLIREIIGV